MREGGLSYNNKKKKNEPIHRDSRRPRLIKVAKKRVRGSFILRGVTPRDNAFISTRIANTPGALGVIVGWKRGSTYASACADTGEGNCFFTCCDIRHLVCRQ